MLHSARLRDTAVRRMSTKPVDRHIALLRGINVGGNKKVPMAALREIAAELGWKSVATYIQSHDRLGDLRPLRDLLDRGPLVALLGEHRAADLDQLVPPFDGREPSACAIRHVDQVTTLP